MSTRFHNNLSGRTRSPLLVLLRDAGGTEPATENPIPSKGVIELFRKKTEQAKNVEPTVAATPTVVRQKRRPMVLRDAAVDAAIDAHLAQTTTLTREEYSRWSRIPESRIKLLIKDGTLPAMKIGKGVTLIDRIKADAALAQFAMKALKSESNGQEAGKN